MDLIYLALSITFIGLIAALAVGCARLEKTR